MSTSLNDMQSMSGVTLIGIERSRQIEDLGYDAAHDDLHRSSEIAIAAICYAIASASEHIEGAPWLVRGLWPWSVMEIPQPAYTVFGNDDEASLNQLIKAGALVAAEIDRRLRLQQPHVSTFGGYELDAHPPAEKDKCEAALRVLDGAR